MLYFSKALPVYLTGNGHVLRAVECEWGEEDSGAHLSYSLASKIGP